MLSCSLRFIAQQEQDDEEELSTTSLTEELANLICTHGLILDTIAPKTETCKKSAMFKFQMGRPSEAYLASEHLNNKTMNLSKRTMGLIQTTYNGRKPMAMKLFFPSDAEISRLDIEKQVKRRFSMFGKFKSIEVIGENCCQIVYEDVVSALRAFEDYSERPIGIHHGSFLELVEDERDGDLLKKRQRIPTSQLDSSNPELSNTSKLVALDTTARSNTSAAKRSRDVAQETAGSNEVPEDSADVSRVSVKTETEPEDDEEKNRRLEAQMKANKEDRQLFIVHSKTVIIEELKRMLHLKPGCESVEVKRRKKSSIARGMTFVTFSTKEFAAEALEDLNGMEYPAGSGSHLKVMLAEAWDNSKKQNKRGESADRVSNSSQHGEISSLSELQDTPTPEATQERETSSAEPSKTSRRRTTASVEAGHRRMFGASASSWNYSQRMHDFYSAESELQRELASRSSTTDALAETFGNVVGFGDMGTPQYQASYPSPWMMAYPEPSPGMHHPPPMYHTHFHPQNYTGAMPQPYPSNMVSPASKYQGVSDTSRLHVVFGRPLPEHEIHRAFDMAAPGLQYISKTQDKAFAFVKYSSSHSAILAMVRLHGSTLMGQKLRVTLADPPPVDSSISRKRQRDVRGRKDRTVDENSKDEQEDEDDEDEDEDYA